MPIAAGRKFQLWPWAVAAVLVLAVAGAASPGLVRARIPESGRQYTNFVVAGVGLMRWCLVAIAGFSMATGFALKRWAAEVVCEPATPPARAFPLSDRSIALALFAAALLLRVPTIGAAFWMDEMNTVERVIDKGLPVVLAFSSEGNNHLLNTLLMYLCEKVFGETEWALRLPVLMLGALTPAAIFLLLRRLIPPGAALAAGCLMVVHFRCVEFSANARGYAGVIFCTSVACCLFAGLWRRFSWRAAAAYILAGAATAAFVPTTLYVAAAHGIASFCALLAAARRRAPSAGIARAAAITGACAWACLLGLSANSLTLPQLLDYARHGAEMAHRKMGLELLDGIGYMMSGASHLAVSCLVLLLSAIGLFRYRAAVWLNIALWAPAALYVAAITALGMRASPRMFVQFIFPCVTGLALFLHSEWQKRRPTVRRVAVVAIAAICVIDSLPEFQRFYFIGNPPLKRLARQLEGQPVLLVGDQSDLNGYYFHGASAVFPKEMDRVAEKIREIKPRFLVGGMDCVEMARGGGWIDIAKKLGYRPLERLNDWTIGEPAGASERQPCFLLMSADRWE